MSKLATCDDQMVVRLTAEELRHLQHSCAVPDRFKDTKYAVPKIGRIMCRFHVCARSERPPEYAAYSDLFDGFASVSPN